MRSTLLRIAAVCAVIAAIASCDTRTTAPTGGGGGGGGGTIIPTGTDKPALAIDTPAVNQLVNVGDSILVVVRLQDAQALASLQITGLEFFGDASLGTLTQSTRYTAPVANFGPDVHDITVRRYLQPLSRSDTTLDSLVIKAVAVDSLGRTDSVTRTVDIVSGPHVEITEPANGDSTPAGIGLSVTVHATHAQGLFSITLHALGQATWPTKLDTTITQTMAGAPRDTVLAALILVPANAPLRGLISLTASAINITGQTGISGTISVFVRGTANSEPLVTQSVQPRSELSDSIVVNAHGDGIVSLGYVAFDSLGATLARDSIVLTAPYSGNAVKAVGLQKVPIIAQGQRISLVGFAVDQAGRTGYAVQPSQVVPVASLAAAHSDSTLIVFGHTYPLPKSRQGTIGDLVWDAVRENVILSNLAFNRLEVFHNQTRTFDASGIAVGSQPWGLAISTNPDTLLVANSGGTNLSRVDLRSLTEATARRIRTRGTYLFTVDEARDSVNGALQLRESVGDPVIYSDRPQYVGQLANGVVYYSTRPTSEAPKGTIRYLDPSQAFPDPKAIIIYSQASASIKTHVVVNADSVFAISGAAANTSDAIRICDHPPGTNLPSICKTTTLGLDAVIDSLQLAIGSDVGYVTGVDITSAGVTDTTYVAVSGDRNWVAFGEGNTAAAGTIFMSSTSNFFSPPITQVDLTNNAAEHINGLALDSNGLTVAAHGQETFFASVDVPFHLRLQGKYTDAFSGAGIAFHPQANGLACPLGAADITCTAYAASNNQSIEIIDVGHYLNRGTLPIKGNLYGPLRAALPGPTDAAAGIILKLFGISTNGLVVIDLRAGDIPPSP